MPARDSGREGFVVVLKARSRNNPPSSPELIRSLKLGNVWVFVQLIHRQTRAKNQLYKNQNIS